MEVLLTKLLVSCNSGRYAQVPFANLDLEVHIILISGQIQKQDIFIKPSVHSNLLHKRSLLGDQTTASRASRISSLGLKMKPRRISKLETSNIPLCIVEVSLLLPERVREFCYSSAIYYDGNDQTHYHRYEYISFAQENVNNSNVNQAHFTLPDRWP